MHQLNSYEMSGKTINMDRDLKNVHRLLEFRQQYFPCWPSLIIILSQTWFSCCCLLSCSSSLRLPQTLPKIFKTAFNPTASSMTASKSENTKKLNLPDTDENIISGLCWKHFSLQDCGEHGRQIQGWRSWACPSCPWSACGEETITLLGELGGGKI